MVGLVLLAAVPTHAQETVPRPDLSRYPRLFSRDNAPFDPNNPDDAAQIIMVGDTSFARGVEEVTNKHGMDYPLMQAAAWLRAADMAVGNYEGVIAADGIGQVRLLGYRLRAQPNAAHALAQAGFRLLSLANNHTMDWGPDGLRATLDNLHSVGIQTVGAGPDGESARKPLVTTVRGVRVVWLAYTMVPEPRREDVEGEAAKGWARAWFGPTFARDKLAGYVRAARQLGDVVIVQFHWGQEYTKCPQDWQYSLARAAVQAGAALVVGHHPHVVQSVEVYQKGFIAYSLGNFLFDQPQAPGLALWVRLDGQGVMDVHALTLRPGAQPEWNPAAKANTDLLGLCLPTRTY
jgi:poly-gamma-glutamate capsule biosynthesis protein CapA/YwtB (metallophosphatase superfamily)